MLASHGQVLSQRGRRDADRVRDADVRQLTSLAQAVGDCAANAQSGCDFLDREKRFARQLGSLGAVAGDTGATNLASQVVASRGLSSLACRSPFRISRACDTVTSRLTRGKRRRSGSGPGGRSFKSSLPVHSKARSSLVFDQAAGLVFSHDAPPRTTGAPFGRKIGMTLLESCTPVRTSGGALVVAIRSRSSPARMSSTSR